jgi:hypothetical protein
MTGVPPVAAINPAQHAAARIHLLAVRCIAASLPNRLDRGLATARADVQHCGDPLTSRPSWPLAKPDRLA